MLDKDDVRSFYDGMWSHYDRGVNRHERHRFGAILGLVETLDRPNRAILDAGCGLGKLSERLVPYGEVTGVEWSATAVEVARARVPAGHFLTGDLIRDDLDALLGRFGLVVCSEVLEHVGRENRVALARKLRNCLSGGGFLILTTPNKTAHDRVPQATPSVHAADLTRPEAWTQPEDDLLTTEELLAVLAEAGFRVDALRCATVLEALWERSALFRRIRSRLPWDRFGRDPFDRWLARTRLGVYNVVLAHVGAI